MKIHKNARLTPLRREEMARSVLAGEMSRPEAARSFGVTAGTVAKWTERFQDLGPAGCADRSSRPRRMSRLTPGHVVERVVSLRRHRLTGARIAAATGVSTATVSRIIKRAGLSRIKGLKPEKPARRYEHDNPGDMTASTSRGPSASTGPATESPEPGSAAAREPAGRRPRPRRRRLARRLRRPVPRRAGKQRRRLPGDLRGLLQAPQGHRPPSDDRQRPCCASRAFAVACKRFGVMRVRTRPYTPKTDGDGELHPDGLSGAGLRLDLRDVGPARRRLSGVDAHAQLAPAARRFGVEAADPSAACGWSGISYRGSAPTRWPRTCAETVRIAEATSAGAPSARAAERQATRRRGAGEAPGPLPHRSRRRQGGIERAR